MKFFISLELMEPGQNHNEKVDVWSYAMVLYEITTNQIPYNHCQNQVQISREVCDKKEKPTFPKDREIDPTLRDLMNRCWNLDPQQRPSFSHIVQTLRDAKDFLHLGEVPIMFVTKGYYRYL
jgi:serine/threonine protein kinase